MIVAYEKWNFKNNFENNLQTSERKKFFEWIGRLLFTAEMRIYCAFAADKVEILMGFAHREAILNGKTRYYSQAERLWIVTKNVTIHSRFYEKTYKVFFFFRHNALNSGLIFVNYYNHYQLTFYSGYNIIYL